MDAEDEESGDDPPGHAALKQLHERGARGDQADDHVEHDVRQLGGAGDLADGRHGQEQAEDGDQDDAEGGDVKHQQRLGRSLAQRGAPLGAERGEDQRQAQKEDQRGEIDGLFLGFGELGVETRRHFVEDLGVGLHPLVERRRQADGPEQEHDPDGVIDVVHDRRAGQLRLSRLKGIGHGDQVARAAHPAAAQSAQSAPGAFAQQVVHQRVRGDEADGDRDRGGEEAQQHLRTQLEDLPDVAAKQHDEDHRIEDRVAQRAVRALGGRRVPKLERAAEHGGKVQQDDGRNVFEELRLRHLLRADEQRGHEHERRKVEESVCNHEASSFKFFRAAKADRGNMKETPPIK